MLGNPSPMASTSPWDGPCELCPPSVPWEAARGPAKHPPGQWKGAGTSHGDHAGEHVLPLDLCRRNGSSALAPGPVAVPSLNPSFGPAGTTTRWVLVVAPSPGCPSSWPRLRARGIYGGVRKAPMK